VREEEKEKKEDSEEEEDKRKRNKKGRAVYRGPIPKPRSNVLHLNVMNHSKLFQNATADEPACHRTCAGCMTGFRLAMKKLTVASILVLVGKEVANRSPTRGKPLNWSRFNRSFLHRLSFLCAE
jgi:hypothetical protein